MPDIWLQIGTLLLNLVLTTTVGLGLMLMRGIRQDIHELHRTLIAHAQAIGRLQGTIERERTHHAVQ